MIRQIEVFESSRNIKTIQNQVNEFLEKLAEEGIAPIDILCNVTKTNGNSFYYLYTIVYLIEPYRVNKLKKEMGT